jgi:hypothetical protein
MSAQIMLAMTGTRTRCSTCDPGRFSTLCNQSWLLYRSGCGIDVSSAESGPRRLASYVGKGGEGGVR